MRNVIGVLFLIATIGAGAAVYVQGHLPTATVGPLRTATIQRGQLLSSITATGTVEPEEVVDVGAQVMGRIRDLGIDLEKVKGTNPPRGAEESQCQGGPSATSANAASQGAGVSDGSGNRPPATAGGLAEPPAADTRPRIDYCSIVHVGTDLAYIDDTKYQAQVRQAQAALDRSIADLEQLEAKASQAAADLRRAEHLRNAQQTNAALVKGGIVAISEADYDLAVANARVAKANVNVGKATVEQDRATLAQVQTDLDYTVIKSPVEGMILDRRVNIGQTVVASLNAPSLFLIAKDLRRIQVWASVNEADIGRIRASMPVRFTVDAYPGEVFHGTVSQVRLNAQMTQNVVTYTVVVTTDNSRGRLLPYLTANVQFEVGRRSDVLLAPNAALRWKPQASQIDPAVGNTIPLSAESASAQDHGCVWNLAKAGFVRPLEVVVGASDGTVTEISGGGVTEGMQVVVGERDTEDEEAVDGETTSNPFLPKPPKGSRPPPGPM